MGTTIATSTSLVDVDQALAVIEKGQQLAGHFPDAEDLDRARRILTDELTPEDARAELRASLARLAEEERAVTHGR